MVRDFAAEVIAHSVNVTSKFLESTMLAIYSPPYDSPIEDLFAYNVIKYLADDVELLPQVPVDTICGRFILDFVLKSANAGKVAIECDGRDFHNESRDEWRDGMILGDGHVDVIYRLRGCDINYHIEDLLYLMSRFDPSLISKRGIINLELLATSEAKSFPTNHRGDICSISYKKAKESLRMQVRRKVIPAGERRFWQAAYSYAVSLEGGDLDQVISTYRSSQTIHII